MNCRYSFLVIWIKNFETLKFTLLLLLLKETQQERDLDAENLHI